MFADRHDAGRQLAKALAGYKSRSPAVVALPRGGVPVAAEVARALEAPLDLLIVRKIGVPDHPELAMGAVADGTPPLMMRNEDVIALAGVTTREFDAARDVALDEVRRRRQRFAAGMPHCDLHGRCVIVVDDGIATGATVRAALAAIRSTQPAEVVLAVPVAAVSVLDGLRDAADGVICLVRSEHLDAVGRFYRDFSQLSDEEVLRELRDSAPRSP
jgi:predicted phosphoribosyltransferase